MARQSFSKAALHKEVAQIKRYQQFLPSLDLKRRQLMAERNKTATNLAKIEGLIQERRASIADNLPMISNENIVLDGLVTVSNYNIGYENNAGVNLPVLRNIELTVKPYSTYAKPHWVDQTVVELKAMLELMVKLQIEQRRLATFDAAVKKVTQRVNFFEKILIPRAQQTVKKITIFLSDNERAGIVRAKITKRKHLGKGETPCP